MTPEQIAQAKKEAAAQYAFYDRLKTTKQGGNGTVPLHEGSGLAATSQFDSGTRHQSKTTIKRRRQMWAEGRKLQLPVKK